MLKKMSSLFVYYLPTYLPTYLTTYWKRRIVANVPKWIDKREGETDKGDIKIQKVL